MSITRKLSKLDLIQPPEYVKNQTQYETIMGSEAYGVSSNDSDVDVYGFCIPNKDIVFPHLAGQIIGFGRQIQRFDQFQQHHVQCNKKEYDISIYNIVKYFQLCMDNNPNIIDSLFTPRRCVLHITQIGEMVRENRKLFLHKGAWFKFKGYAFSQVNKMKNKNNRTGKRKEIIEKYSFDLKFAYHVVRLLNEIEQILTEGDLDLERNREQLKAIRRGDWKEGDILAYFGTKERELETLYTNSKLQHKPDEEAIKQLLLNCLEQHFGSLEKCVLIPNKEKQFISELEAVINKYR